MGTVRGNDQRGSPLRALLSESEFLATTSVGVALFDKHGVIVDCNDSVARLIGCSRDELIGRSIYEAEWDTVRRDGQPFAVSEMPGASTFATGEPAADAIMGLNIANGSRRWFTVNVCAAVVDGTIKGVISSYFDLTDQVVREQSLELLTEVNRSLAVATDADEFITSVCTAFVTVGGYALAYVATSGSDHHGSAIVARADATPGATTSASFIDERGGELIDTALRTRTTQVRLNLSTAEPCADGSDPGVAAGLRSAVALPLLFNQAPAAIVVCSRHPFEFGESVVRGLEHIAREIELSSAHVASMNQLERSLDGTIAALARMTENRDPYTAGHQLGVGRLGEAIARELGMDERMASLIRQSGVVHDVGKISIPAEILTRPGRLNELEFSLIKKHPEVGADILTEASLPWPIAEVARQHHERMDGSGYPYGLAGSAISLPARIIAVADVIEAMTHHRPYRPGLGLDVALDEVRKGRGRLYDADVVTACLAVFDSGYVMESKFGLASI